ncbi:MAG: glycine cleavage system aminomethyltransferase GcvT [Chloroflexota bacterium]
MVEKKTALYQRHIDAGARVVPFAGFLMPVQYAGIVGEHQAVRERAGMFDLSHMGEFEIRGPGALAAVDRLVTNDIQGLQVGQIRYTPMTYPDGGIVDDILVYRYSDHLMLVVNAANIEKDRDWIGSHLPPDAQFTDVCDQVALIAVQGPRAEGIVQDLTPVKLGDISYYHFAEGEVNGTPATISRTGYTGENGFELYVAPNSAPSLWQALLRRGEPDGLVPAGLGARDTLRLEAGYMLYGNDIDHTTSPLEAGLGWTVKFGEQPFSGREVLERQKSEGVRRRMMALEMADRAIPRPHCRLYLNGEGVGEITSGTFSPTLQRGIGLGYVATGLKAGTELQVDIRGQRHPALLVRKPHYKREGS